MAEAVGYTLNQWAELNVFAADGSVPIDNNVSEREMKRVRGRTDWARTIQRDLPLSFDPGPFYYRPQQRFLVADVEHPVTRVHAATLWRAARELGLWSPPVPEDARLASLTADEAEMTIRLWRDRIYRDRDLRLCRWIETFWSSRRHVPASVAARPELWDVTDKFETVWEAMCRWVLTGRESEVGEWMPGGQYIPLPGFNLDNAGLDLRQDIIVRDRGNNVLLVLDAKFYTEGHTPKTQDILKQLAYAYYASSCWLTGRDDPSCIINAFLMPGMWEGGPPLRVAGRHVLTQSRGRPMGVATSGSFNSITAASRGRGRILPPC